MMKHRYTYTLLALLSLTLSGCDVNEENPLVIQQEAVEAFVAGDYQESLINLKMALKADPLNPEMRKLLGEVWLKLGDPGACVEQLIKSKELGMNENELILPFANCHLYAGEFDKILDLKYSGQQFSVSNQDHAHLFALKAQASIGLGNTNMALDYLDQALSLSSAMPEVILAKAHWLAAKGENDKALDVLLQLKAENPKFAKAWGLIADIYRFKHQLNDAESAYTQAILYTDNQLDLINYYLYRALVRTYNQQLSEAQDDLNRIQSINKNHPGAIYLQGLIALSQHHYNQAIAAFQKVMVNNKSFVYGHYFLGLSHLLSKQYHSAREHLIQFSNSLPNHVLGQKLLALVEVNLVELNSAKARLLKLQKAHPEDADIYQLLGEIYLRNGEIEIGAEYLSKAIKLDPKRTDTHLKLGLARLDLQDTQAARWAFDQVLERQPQYQKALLLKFINEFKSKHYQLAMNLANTYIRYYPKEPLGYNLQGLVHYVQGEENEAIQAFEDARKRDIHDPNANTHLALIALNHQDMDTAKQYLAKTLERYPHIPSMLRMAKIYFQAKQPSHAVTYLERAVVEDPGSLSAHLALTRHYLHQKAMDKAVAQMQRVPTELQDNQSYVALRGILELSQNNKVLATKTYKTILKEYKHLNALSLEFLAMMAVANQDWLLFEKWTDAMLQLKPRGDWTRLKSQALWNQNKHQASIEVLEAWRKQYPQDIQTQLWLANYLMRDKQYTKAQKIYLELINKKKEIPLVYNNLAWILKDKDPQQAQLYAKKALSLKPGWPQAEDTLNAIELILNQKNIQQSS